MIDVVLVDDHALVREGLRHVLEDAGVHIVAEAGNGEEGVEVVLANRPDVVLMDVSMPVVDGIEATRRVIADWPEARVVILTIHDESGLRRSALTAGAVGYLVKDCSGTEVVDAVRLAADDDAALSANLAQAMLDESSDATPALTDREREVLQLVADGKRPKEVAHQLAISVRTVNNHLAAVYRKLDARGRLDAVLLAARLGIIRLPGES
ncbi:MAG: response regulator [Acidimicrobiia bacterium]